MRRLPGTRRLASDYTHAFGDLAAFFAGDPADESAWREAVTRTRTLNRPRRELAAALVAQQEGFEAPRAAVEAARRLSDQATVAVVTGQQAGLFGGPLYTLLKAITAIRLAADFEAREGVPTVAVFWIESEDHDWDEVASCAVFDGDFERRVVTLSAPPGAGSQPVAALHLGQTAAAAVDRLGEVLPATEFTATLLDGLREAYRDGTTMSQAFGRWLSRILGEYGLVVYDAADRATKPLVRQVFARELEHPGETSRLAVQAGEALASRGYHAQVTPQDGAVALFHLDGARSPIEMAGGGVSIGGTMRPLARVLEDVEARPWMFSPNVLLRPIVEDTLFATVAYVAGPNELAYLAQLRQVYEHFSVPMPLMAPRASATLLDSPSVRFLGKPDVRFEALQRHGESALNALLERQLPASVERALDAARADVTSRMEALVGALPDLDPTLAGAARSTLGRMTHDLDALHGKVVQAAKRRDETLRRQFARTQALAFPGGEPQERTIGFVSFLNRYGPALVERLMTELPLEPGQHWLLAI